MKKTIYLLNIDNYAPEITRLTYPYIERYADKIGADVVEIKERKFPEAPVVYEKLQIQQLAKENGSDWNIYIDSDTMVHPECIDFTEHITKDTVLHNGADFANVRWKYDEYFKRDGRNIGSCNWFAIASDWCLDLWSPLDISFDTALGRINPTLNEIKNGIDSEHLIDDYTLSRNIAKYGLKFDTVIDLANRIGAAGLPFLWHEYCLTNEQKVKNISELSNTWRNL